MASEHEIELFFARYGVTEQQVNADLVLHLNHNHAHQFKAWEGGILCTWPEECVRAMPWPSRCLKTMALVESVMSVDVPNDYALNLLDATDVRDLQDSFTLYEIASMEPHVKAFCAYAAFRGDDIASYRAKVEF